MLTAGSAAFVPAKKPPRRTSVRVLNRRRASAAARPLLAAFFDVLERRVGEQAAQLVHLLPRALLHPLGGGRGGKRLFELPLRGRLLADAEVGFGLRRQNPVPFGLRQALVLQKRLADREHFAAHAFRLHEVRDRFGAALPVGRADIEEETEAATV